MSKTHRIKTLPEYFQAVLEGRKPFEIRKNDRDFKVGDLLILEEWSSEEPSLGGYTGRVTSREVVYITDFGQIEGYVVMGIADEWMLGRILTLTSR